MQRSEPARVSATDRHLGRVARGGLVGLMGAVVSALAGFVLVVTVARGLDPGPAGVFFATTSVFLVLVALCGLGTDAGLARFLLRLEATGRPDQLHGTVRRAAWPVLGSALLASALLLLAADRVADGLGLGDTAGAVLRLLAIALPFAVAAEFALAVTRALGRMRTTAAVDKVSRAGLQVLVVVAVLGAGGGLVAVVAAWACVYALSAVLAAVLARRMVARRPGAVGGGRVEPVEGFWRFTWPRGVARLAQIGIQKADIVIVAALLTPAHAALYTAATRFVSLGQFATLAINQVLQPRFTAILVKDDVATLREVHRVATAWSMLLAWPVHLVVGAAPLLYLSIFGADYVTDAAVLVVVAMAAAMLVAVASGPVDTLLLMAGRSRASLGNAVVALAVDVVLCLLLVPVWGIPGAAAAWAGAVVVRCGLAFVQVRRHLGVTAGGPACAVAALAPVVCLGAPVAALSLVIGASWLGLVLVLVPGMTAYVVVLHRYRRLLRLDVLAAALGPGPAVRRATAAARSRLPAPARTAVRWLALQWGRLTADLRREPSFLIAGAQRAGTTTLFRLLEAHPHLVRPTLSKGTGYFDDHHHRGRRWYRAHFPLRWAGRLRAGGGPVHTFECSGYYLFHPLAAGRIARELPDAKVVVLVRDPVERAYSAHRHELARGFEHLDFTTAIAQEEQRLAGEAERLRRDPRHRSYAHRHHGYLGRSTYAPQVRRLIDELGADRVRVVDADAFFADPVREFAALQRWLGIPVWEPPAVEQWNARPRDPLPPEQRAALMQHFAEHDRELTELTGWVPTWRVTEVKR